MENNNRGVRVLSTRALRKDVTLLILMGTRAGLTRERGLYPQPQQCASSLPARGLERGQGSPRTPKEPRGLGMGSC